jgi:cell division septation protein DedD
MDKDEYDDVIDVPGGRNSSLKLMATVDAPERDTSSASSLYGFDLPPAYYADEASLYSIAEDSREDRQSQSDLNSRASEKPQSLQSLSRGTTLREAQWSAVEVRWVSQDGVGGLADSEDGFEEDNRGGKYYGASSRRTRMYAFLTVFLVLVLAVSLGVAFSQDSNPDRSTVGSGATVDESVVVVAPSPTSSPTTASPTTASPTTASPTTASPTTASPSLAPTRSNPTFSPASTSQVLSTSYLKKILSKCTPEYILLDKETLQGQVFLLLLEEEMAAADAVSGGQIFFDVNRGEEYIMERYALMMLFLSTNGNGWENANGWMDPERDVCTWYGVLNCQDRNEGTCAVLNLNLSK